MVHIKDKKTNNVDLFFKIHGCQVCKDSTEAIFSYKFESDIQWVSPNFPAVPEGKFRFLKCNCGHHDFNDDGITINGYSCNGCGRFVEVIFKN